MVQVDGIVVAIKTRHGGAVIPLGPIPPRNVGHLSVSDVELGNINTIVDLAGVVRLGTAFGREMCPVGPADMDGNCP